MSQFKELCTQLESSIQTAYEEGVTLEQAEKLAAKFLYGQMQVSERLREAGLDARMRKSGVKAIRANIYLDAIRGVDKKPTEAALASMLDSHEVVQGEQEALDRAEVSKEELERLYDIFVNAHIYFRGVAKGNFGG